MNLVTYIKRVPLWVYLLLLGVITFYTYEIRIASDMGWYMNSALNIFMGKGYTNMDGSLILNRGPVFPLMIAASYWMMGVSPWSAFWVVRIFCILNPIMIYFLGKKFYGKWVGFSAALLTLTSYSINYWSYRHIDAVWPFFILLALYLLYEGLEREKTLYLAYAGVSIGISFLIKEVAILFFPLPLLSILIIRQFRKKQNLKGAIMLYGALFLTISPWIFYQISHGSASSILGNAGPAVLESIVKSSGESTEISSTGLLFVAGKYIDGLINFYKGQQNSLSENFIFAPMFIVAWAFLFFKALKGDNPSKVLLCSGVCFCPIIYFMGVSNFRLGQGLYFYYLSYLALACLIYFLSQAICKLIDRFDLKVHRIKKSTVFISVMVLTVGGQFFFSHNADSEGRRFFERSYFYKVVSEGECQREIVGLYGSLDKIAGTWIKDNLPLGSRLMVSRPSEGKPVYFYSGTQYPLFRMPVIKSNKLPEIRDKEKNANIIFLSSWTARNDPRNKVFALTESVLLSDIEKYEIDYIIVHKRRNYLSLYFERNDNFARVEEFGSGIIKIYKVLSTKPMSDFKPLVSTNLTYYLRELKGKDPMKIDWYVEHFFKPWLGWEQQEVERLIYPHKGKTSMGYTIVKNGKVY